MRMEADGDAATFEVGPGTIIFVPARTRHSFHDITERLALLVFFGLAEQSGTTGSAVTSTDSAE